MSNLHIYVTVSGFKETDECKYEYKQIIMIKQRKQTMLVSNIIYRSANTNCNDNIRRVDVDKTKRGRWLQPGCTAKTE